MRKPSLVTQILAVNALLITATGFAAVVAARLQVEDAADRRQMLVLAAGIFATVLVNGVVLRRRFAPLERLIDVMERIDLTAPGVRADVPEADSADVVRLHQAFNRMLARLEDERSRTAASVLRAQEDERARLARDLHDECNQALTGVLLRLEATAQGAPEEVRDELRETKALATEAMDELLRLARERRDQASVTLDSWSDLVDRFSGDQSTFAWCHWDGTRETEAKIKEETQVTIRCIPLPGQGPAEEAGSCIKSGRPSPRRVLMAKAY